MADRFTIDVHIAEGEEQDAIADDVRRGLTAPQKSLPSKYFYDDVGSALFERITELPEYYQTRTELAILRTIVGGLAASFGFEEVVELGSGSSKKTTILLDALEQHGTLRRFIPFDVNAAMVRQSAGALLARYPRLRVHGVVGDFERHLERLPRAEGRRLVLFLGSTIGNLDVAERQRFLAQVRHLLDGDGALLLGVDLVKDVARLEAAYDDAGGVTAEFNRNILRVVNRRLHADFAVEAYRHHAFYNREAARIEMHLAPESPQQVYIRDLGLYIAILPDETIWTEISCKYTRESARAALSDAGLQLTAWYTDPEQLFGLALARA